MTHFLKYVASRLFFGTFGAILAVYWSLVWVHEVLYEDRGIEDSRIIIWTYVASVVLVSALMSLWGRWRVNRILNVELERLRREYHPKLLIRGYSRMMNYLASCFFFNTSRARLTRQMGLRFGEMLLGMTAEDDQAVAIYEDILLREPDQEKFYNFLIRAYSRRARLSEKSFDFLRRRYHERPDDRLVGILAREYTLRKKLNYESERVLLRCVELYPRHRYKILSFAVPRLLSYRRTDDNAAQFYLAAAEAGSGGKLSPILRRLEERYQEKGREDALAYRLARVLHDKKIPEGSAPDQKATYTTKESGSEWGDVEDEDVSDFELAGLDYGDESLERQSEIEDGDEGQPAMSLDSRFHALVQRLFASDGATRGRLERWIIIVFILIVLAVGGWYAWPWVKGIVSPENKPGGPAAVTGTEEVQEQTAPGEPEAAVQEQSAGEYTIQAGAFSDSARAAAYVGQLKARGIKAYLAGPGAGSKIYKVRLGAFATDEEADRAARNLVRQRIISEWRVVKRSQ